MRNTRNLANALETVLRDYRLQAQKAVIQNEGRLLVPAGIDYYTLNMLAENPDRVTSKGNSSGEPSYVSLEDAKRGRNEDGSSHRGFIVLDVLAKKVVDLLDNNGASIIPQDERYVRVNGHGAGLDTDKEASLLGEEMGGFLIMVGIRPYASWGCRCPSLHADVYPDKQSAEDARTKALGNGHIKEDAKVKQITPEFLREYSEVRKRR